MPANGAGFEDLDYRITDAAVDAYSAVIIDSTNSTGKKPTATLAADSVAPCFVLQDAVTAANQVRTVRDTGRGLVRVDANSVGITAGDILVPSANGRFIKILTLDDTAQHSIGMAEEDSAADNDVISCKFRPDSHVKGTA